MSTEPTTSRPSALGARLERHRVAVGLAAAALATGMAVLWFVVVPDGAATATGWRGVALRYGHGACWALLALTALLYAVRVPRRLPTVTAYAALAAYAAFLVATLR